LLIERLDKQPQIDASVYIAPNAVICGDVKIGVNTRVMFGATVIAEGGSIEIGDNCVILENAVLRSTVKHSLVIGNQVLIGPNAHVVGCIVEDNVFIATGASIFHGARLCHNSEIAINGVVHIKTVLPENETVPIGWIAVGNPVQILPPDKHEERWAIQKPLNFPKFVYGVDRKPEGQTIMPEIMKMMSDTLKSHKNDKIIEE
jgi:carbonic anhydrase/acetyltransferase-like protein (isoleucine patch superfamily)